MIAFEIISYVIAIKIFYAWHKKYFQKNPKV